MGAPGTKKKKKKKIEFLVITSYKNIYKTIYGTLWDVVIVFVLKVRFLAFFAIF